MTPLPPMNSTRWGRMGRTLGQRQRPAALSTASAAGPALDERRTGRRAGRWRARGDERVELAGADAALGADHDEDVAVVGQRDGGQGGAASSWSTRASRGPRRRAPASGAGGRPRGDHAAPGRAGTAWSRRATTDSHLRRAFGRARRARRRRCARPATARPRRRRARSPPRPPARRGRPWPAPARGRAAGRLGLVVDRRARGPRSSCPVDAAADRARPRPPVGEQHRLAGARSGARWRRAGPRRRRARTADPPTAPASRPASPRNSGGSWRSRAASVRLEGVAQLAEEALLGRREPALRALLAAQRRELAEQLLLLARSGGSGSARWCGR